jgi:WD40 repeat protein
MITGGTHFRHWDIDRGKQIRRFPEQDAVRSVAFGPGGKTLATADGMTLRLWEAATGRELRQFRGKHALVDELAISADGTIIAAADDEGTIIVWDATTGREIRHGGDKTERPSIAFAPDGKTYAVSDKQGARLWDTATGREIRSFPRSDQAVRSLCFASSGKSLAIAYGRSVMLWDVATGRSRQTLDHLELVNAVAFAPDGESLATGDNTGYVCLWDVATGRDLGRFGDHRDKDAESPSVISLAFLPDGKTVAVATDIDGGTDPSLRLWDTDTGKVRRRLEGHTNSVYGVAVAPDGKTMASASADGTTLVWDVSKIGE